MYKENIEFLEKMLLDKRPAYDVLSFAADTVDAMRTSMFQKRMTPEQRIDFDAAMAKVSLALRDLDAALHKS